MSFVVSHDQDSNTERDLAIQKMVGKTRYICSANHSNQWVKVLGVVECFVDSMEKQLEKTIRKVVSGLVCVEPYYTVYISLNQTMENDF